MKHVNNQIIIGIDHGYGNIKTANHCFKTGLLSYDSEPTFTKDMLVYNGRYYLFGEGHKEFFAEKTNDEEYYIMTLAAIAEIASALKGLTVIADIGNGTMNTLYMVNGKPQSANKYTDKFGTYQCTLAVREEFQQKTNRELNDIIIDEVLRTGTADISASDLKIIRKVAAEYVQGIFRRLREHGYDENTMKLVVTGGGGCLVRNFARIKPERIHFVEDICAAAKGYEYMAELQLKKR